MRHRSALVSLLAVLLLTLTVVDAGTCKPLPGATVDLWHADATGNYSGFGATTCHPRSPAPPALPPPPHAVKPLHPLTS